MLDIGLEIRILRERMKVSAKELAEKVGLSQSQISRLEKGQRRIDTQVLHRIAQALGVSVSHFFKGGEVPNDDAFPRILPDTVGKLIRSERRRRHISAEELATRVGKPKALIQNIEEGKREPDAELIGRIIKALRLSPQVLIGSQQKMINGLEAQIARLNAALSEATRGDLRFGVDQGEGEPLSRRGTPILGTLADGYPREFDPAGRPLLEVVDFVYVPELDQQDAFALHAVGDSMETSGSPSFREGDVLIFASATLRSRDFGFVRLANDEATFRQVFFEPGGRVRLQPLNLNRPPSTYSREDVLATWRLIGHVGRY